MYKLLLTSTLLSSILTTEGVEGLAEREELVKDYISQKGENKVNLGVLNTPPEFIHNEYALKLETVKALELAEKKRKEEQILKELEKLKQTQVAKHGLYEGQVLDFEATAYTPYCTGCSGVTKTGQNVRINFQNIVAVDPSVIPLHSTLEVYVDGKLYGQYYAGDTGGAIKGRIIDVLHRTKDEAYTFGRKQVKVKIIKLP